MEKTLNAKRLAKHLLFISVIALITLSSCLQKDLYDENNKKGTIEEVTLDNYFDYSTTKKVQLNLNYGEECSKAYFEVYAQNPLTYQQEGGQILKDKSLLPVASGFTDGKGVYNEMATIPASVSEVYIYSPDFGVPTLFKTTVAGGQIKANITFENELDITESSAVRGVQARATESFLKTSVPNILGSWNYSGTPNYLNASKKIKVDSKLKSYITTYFPEGGDNSRNFISDNADILIKKDANVWINYFGGTTGAQSVFAYYCYREGDTEAQIREAVKHACTVFPSAHKDALGDYSGVAVDLKFINREGNIPASEPNRFPAGTKIGFLLWNNGWLNTNFSGSTYYSTKILNSDGRSHTAIFGAQNDQGDKFNIITMEDWGDNDYNDVAFTITSNPITAIEVPDATNPGDRKGTDTYRGLLAFEDNWPQQGDYDMNDVVLKYLSNIDYNSDNMVLNINDKFTLVWSGAQYRNSFCYEVPYDLSKATKVTVTGSSSYSISGNVITLFTDAKKELGISDVNPMDMPLMSIPEVTYNVTITFDNPTVKKSEIAAPYNPFIRLGKTEVHLVNYKPTNAANNVFPSGADISEGASNNTYFISKDGYPFAIHMDARIDESLMNIDLRKEGIPIDQSYPKFAEWVKTRDPQIKWW